jgi:hypothetical protein
MKNAKNNYYFMTNNNEELQEEVLQEEIVQSSETDSNDQEQDTNESQEETVTLSKSEFTKLKRQAIAYKSQKENQPAPAKVKTGSPDINKEELYLVAKGYDDEAIEQLQIIARGSGTSLKEALENPLFKFYEAKQNEENRKAKARLGASNGSGFQSGKPAITPNMTEDAHKAIWAKMKNNLN